VRLQARRRLIGLPLAAAAVYFFAANSQVVWLYLVSAMILAAAGLGLAGPVVVLRRVRLVCTGFTREGFDAPLRQDRGKVFMGDLVRLYLRYRGDPSRLRLGPVVLADGSLWPSETEAGAEGQLTLIGRAARRGDLHLAHLRVSSSWPVGLLSAERSLPLGVDLLVHPRYVLPAHHERQGLSPGPEEGAQRGAGLDFIGVRDYRPGDGLRQVHWPTTARRDALMVVETAQESQTPARYQLELRTGAALAGVELGVSMAASFAAGRAAAFKPFRLHVLGEEVVAQQWAQALAALAHAAPTAARSRAAGVPFDTRITADHEGVLMETRQGSLRLAPQTGLAEALAALSELT
jgi:uncharacterized protein (DUF58 family)